MTHIRSIPLYPDGGYALACRRNIADYLVIEEPWPAASIGDEIEVETTNHWVWNAVVANIRDPEAWTVRIVGKKLAMPLPPVVAGQPYVLPYVSGDAWSTRPDKGKILTIDGQAYKVTHAPKRAGMGYYAYQLAPVSAEARATRLGRVAIKGLTDPDRGSYRYYGHNVGRVVAVGGEWLHVERVERQAYGSGEGDQVFGHTTWGVGHFIPAAKAAKLQAMWEKKERIRDLEHELIVARQDPDYGGRPEAVPGLLAALAEAKLRG